MSRRVGRATLLFFLVAATACSAPGSGPAPGAGAVEGIGVGNVARDFALPPLGGAGAAAGSLEEVSLRDYRGRVVLVNFWATWCGPCKAEIPDLEAAYRELAAEGLVVLGVNVQESAAVVEAFVDDLGMTYPVLLDTAGELMQVYRVPGLPTSIFVDREGIVRVRHAGYLSAGQLDDYLDDLLPERESRAP